MFRNMGWRWFPIGLIAAMGFVFLVNGYMVYTAVLSFPGESGQDGFDLSNAYGKVVETADRQAALGWRITASQAEQKRPLLRLLGQDAAPLPPALIDATAERPVGPPETTRLTFQPLPQGRYVADISLADGQWDILLTIRAGNQRFTTTRRLIVK
jgi:nitrogen fixation protein FixH